MVKLINQITDYIVTCCDIRNPFFTHSCHL